MVEVLIASAMVGALSIVIMNMNKQMIRGQKTAESGMEKIDLKSRLIKVLSNRSICTANFSDPFTSSFDRKIFPKSDVSNSDNTQTFFYQVLEKVDAVAAGEGDTGDAQDSAWSTTVTDNSNNFLKRFVTEGHTGFRFEGYRIEYDDSRIDINPNDYIGERVLFESVIKFFFSKRATDISMGGASFQVSMRALFTGEGSASDEWTIKGCNGVSDLFTEEVACTMLGGEMAPNLAGENFCVNIAGYTGNMTMVSSNTALGQGAAEQLILTSAGNTGDDNVAIGSASLNQLTAGSKNVAVGVSSLRFATGSENVAVGFESLAALSGTTSGNTAIGTRALSLSTSGARNTALGTEAIQASTSGQSNTGVGFHSLKYVTSGGGL